MQNFANAKWIFEPEKHRVQKRSIEITTEPRTDFWQRSYYGFKHNNAPALLIESTENFTFTSKVAFEYKTRFDQCGVIIYLNRDCWFKASIEYENDQYSRLGSVVTNKGHSDWATTNIILPDSIWYRLSRRGPDFLIEHSLDGVDYRQMRIFHLHDLGETTQAMGTANPPLKSIDPVRFGVYACSPLDSSFTATFSEIDIVKSTWLPHEA
jgi:regulation of enolase protein 1 (concanavalin A-like superfamily)